jgi:sugar-specific transcriptional regulator TrmB
MTRAQERTEDLIRCLKSLGMTKYEALVYIALLHVTSDTASGIHESSGVPRASVYPVLDQLLEKDLVFVSHSAPKRFAALPPGKAIKKLTDRIGRDADEALAGLEAIHARRMAVGESAGELIWNLYGLTVIKKRLVELISGAESEIRIIAHARVFSDEVQEALSRASGQVSAEVITSAWDGPLPEGIALLSREYACLTQGQERIKEAMTGGICIIDGRKAMVIIGSGEDDAVALFSESTGFVRFFIRYYSLVASLSQAETDQ